MKKIKSSRSDRIGSDLREINIFVGLTMIIFFVAVGFPTLLNTNPSFGYENVNWTPVTSYYQEAYAQQEVMQTLASSNYNPIVLSAFLVIPTTLDNPPPDPAQYFELKYAQPTTIEQGFAETVRPEMIVVSNYELMLQRGSWTPIAWKEFFYLVEKPVTNLIDDDFIDNPLIPSAFAERIYIQSPIQQRVTNDIGAISSTCESNALPDGGTFTTGGQDVSHTASSVAGGCVFTIFTTNPLIPPDMADTVQTRLSGIVFAGKMSKVDSNYDCGVAQLQGVPDTDFRGLGEMTAGESWHNATNPKIGWTTNFNSGICRLGVGTLNSDGGYGTKVTASVDFVDRFLRGTHPDGTNVCDPTDDSVCSYSVAQMDNNTPQTRQGSPKSAGQVGEYFSFNVDPKTNATDGHWQMKEHSFYPSGIMDDCGFSSVGDLFRIDSGSTDAEQGQCIIFKTFHNGNPEFDDDFNTDVDWTTTDAPRFSVNTVKEQLEIRVDDQSSASDGFFIEFPQLDFKWVVQIPYNGTFTNGTALEHEVWFVVSNSVIVNPETGTNDLVGIGWRVDSTAEGGQKRILTTFNESFPNFETVSNGLLLNTTDLGSAIDDGCLEIQRNHHRLTYNFYDNTSCSGTPLQTDTRAGTGGNPAFDIDELDTFVFQYSDENSGGTGSIDIDIHNVTLWKGVTSRPPADFTPDISVFVNASGTGSSQMLVYADVMDGKMDMATSYTSFLSPIVPFASDMFENQLRADLGTGTNHRLGITELSLPFEGEILLKPNYDSGSEDIFTVFIGLKDNSTDGTITLDINNVTVGTNFNNFPTFCCSITNLHEMNF